MIGESQLKAIATKIRKIPLWKLFAYTFVLNVLYSELLYYLYPVLFWPVSGLNSDLIGLLESSFWIVLLVNPLLVFVEELFFRLPILGFLNIKNKVISYSLIAILQLAFTLMHLPNAEHPDVLYTLLSQGVGSVFLTFLFIYTIKTTKSTGTAFWSVWLYHVLFNGYIVATIFIGALF
jgi:hypothetical protein